MDSTRPATSFTGEPPACPPSLFFAIATDASSPLRFYIALLPVQWLLMYAYMVETKGYTLEEIALQFEGEAAPVAQVVHHTVVGDKDSEKYGIEA